MQSNDNIQSKELAKTIYGILDDKKAENIKVLKVREQTSITDYFVIANGTSTTHLKALSDSVSEKLAEYDVHYTRQEGYPQGNWIVMDYNTVIVHIFLRDTRDFYKLEKLWSEGTDVDVNEI